jgi:NADH:ubiquinone oxidoreductase subunit 6 (subunit J)
LLVVDVVVGITGISKATLGGAVVAAFLGGVMLGALAIVVFQRLRAPSAHVDSNFRSDRMDRFAPNNPNTTDIGEGINNSYFINRTTGGRLGGE